MLKLLIYNKLRTLMLPLKQIDNALPQRGLVLDLGCGQGLLATYIAGKKLRFIIGIDKNINRLPKSKLTNLKFKSADINTYKFTKVDGIILSDVLHHLKRNDQKKLIKKIYTNLKKHGKLIIKEIDTSELIRSKLSRFWDFVFYPKEKIYFTNSKDLLALLTGLGFKVKIIRSCRLFPGSTTLFICRK